MRREVGRRGSPPWMMTYGDMMTLLLVFFVALLAMSELKRIKIVSVVVSLRKALGVMKRDVTPELRTERVVSTPAIAPIPGKPTGLEMSAIEEIRKEIETRAEVKGTLFQVVGTVEGPVIRIKEELLFDQGLARVKPDGRKYLLRIAKYIAATQSTVRVEGHTDDVPISTRRFPSNWELSVARATAVLRILVEGGVPKSRIHAAGFADTRPIVPNTSAENRAMNRRVEIKLLSWLPPEKEREREVVK